MFAIPFVFRISLFYRIKGFLSIDIDVSELQVNQCSSPRSKNQLYAASMSADKYYDEIFTQIEIFHESNKCHPTQIVIIQIYTHKFSNSILDLCL